MVFSPSHIVIRNGKFHFNIRFPSDLIPVFGTLFIRKTLKTSDEKVARRSAETLMAKIRASFDLLRSGVLSEEQTLALIGPLTQYNKESGGNTKGSREHGPIRLDRKSRGRPGESTWRFPSWGRPGEA